MNKISNEEWIGLDYIIDNIFGNNSLSFVCYCNSWTTVFTNGIFMCALVEQNRNLPMFKTQSVGAVRKISISQNNPGTELFVHVALAAKCTNLENHRNIYPVSIFLTFSCHFNSLEVRQNELSSFTSYISFLVVLFLFAKPGQIDTVNLDLNKNIYILAHRLNLHIFLL